MVQNPNTKTFPNCLIHKCRFFWTRICKMQSASHPHIGKNSYFYFSFHMVLNVKVAWRIEKNKIKFYSKRVGNFFFFFGGPYKECGLWLKTPATNTATTDTFVFFFLFFIIFSDHCVPSCIKNWSTPRRLRADHCHAYTSQALSPTDL